MFFELRLQKYIKNYDIYRIHTHIHHHNFVIFAA